MSIDPHIEEPLTSGNPMDSSDRLHMLYFSDFDVHKFPVDVWQVVFKYCIKPKSFDSREILVFPIKVHSSMNITLSHVCRYFRAMALSTPSLWSTLDLNESKAQFDTFLERSSQAPIAIVDSSYRTRFSIPNRHAETFERIHSRVVAVENPISFLEISILNVHHNLQELMVTGTGVGGFGENVKQILNDFKRLKTLVWHGVPRSKRDVKFSSTARYNLTSLRLGSPHEETLILGLLRSCPLLESLLVRTVGSGRTAAEATVSLPRLKKLQVHLDNFDHWLSKVQGPRILDSFNVDFEYNTNVNIDQEWDFWPISLDLGRSLASCFMSWLANEPGILKSLSLTRQLDSGLNMYLENLKPTDGKLPFPNLEELRIPDEGTARYVNENSLFEIYSSRLQAGLKPLRVIWRGKLLCPLMPGDDSDFFPDDENRPDRSNPSLQSMSSLRFL
ncbi:hypothetical protein CPB86DRAFT_788528 [Serendipita vermifera]|nr:hypothetical protein CPB86DRAFT_788528 [Serendipita vermifera]